ncbi:MAG: hypothetical protein EAZ78_25000 [Oscillatoriales cyanobacterium]|uniref:DUF6972 domain-containing protein n=1 Tax=Microcoleus anatoxicus PTRS2 TaxID=2705321 RepID=A0ABU8YTY7_9CYAN|nr:MAG: hypothetical protein EA000_07175 [Oscillatoriales cyanobacterium]TAD96276.1 MAG: hypothetical protein EAZ96_26100 [Oscillatoriales cyanobacterium]TAD99014.1 MAG: hypothetical protein EAZ98_05135 [Oscillatoriales cyanobacterium]TAE97921.1 MAG: hypothetical protein EAZ78_25000 [Oscillatoriales cyanobacterium]TAF42512.1 MAG: hypothetical protein EAZ68_09800 [Oscillatoriales cyanobacterium]
MSGINRQITLDSRHTAKHLPDTPQMRRLLNKGRAAHVFNDEATLNQVAQAIIENGEFTGMIRGYDRYGMFFVESIGYRVDPDGSRLLLYYGEIKVNVENRYHVTPRSRPSEE